MSELEPVSNCCYAPLADGRCSACGELADPATDVAKDTVDPVIGYYCHWCQRTTDHKSAYCPVKLAQVEAATHQL